MGFKRTINFISRPNDPDNTIIPPSPVYNGQICNTVPNRDTHANLCNRSQNNTPKRKRSCDSTSVAGSPAFHICVSNQGSDFGWCRGGVNGVFSFQKDVAALWKIKILYCPAVAQNQHFDHKIALAFVDLLYHSLDRIATNAHPVGKSYASKVDDEKSAFEQGRKHQQNGHKKSRYLYFSCVCR